MKTKYPLEVASVVRKTKTFSIDSCLEKADGSERGEAPLEMYAGFSRFSFKLLEKNEGKAKATSINIRIPEIEDIIKRGEYALQKQLDFEIGYGDDSLETQSIAYTTTFTMGNHKGKTPVDLIREGKADELESQKAFLKGNVDKYPKNQKIIDAIDETLKLQSEGKLNAASKASVSKNITLYDSGMKPQIRKTRADGKSEVDSAKIVWNVGSEYPVTVEITNYYADVVKQLDGRLNVRNTDKDSITMLRITISEKEWMDITRKIKTNMQMFEILNAREMFATSQKIYAEQLVASKKA